MENDKSHIPKDSILLQDTEPSYEIPDFYIQKANLQALKLNLDPSDSLPIRCQFLINSIPLLDNISTQILRLIAIGPYEETLAIITSDEPTPKSLLYKDLVELFEQIKRIYSEDDPFLNINHFLNNNLSDSDKKSLKSFENSIDLVIKKSNLTTFLLSTLGSIEVGFYFLNESFLDVFCPINDEFFDDNNNFNKFGKLLKTQAALFLELKTQAYISALENGDRSKSEILNDIFPDDLSMYLLKRRNSNNLSPSELDFINRSKSRKETLLNTENDDDLSENYDWLIFLKELFNYVSKNIGSLILGKRNSKLNYLLPLNLKDYSNLSKDELKERLSLQKEKEIKLNKDRELETLKKKKPTTSNKAKGPPRIKNIMRRPWSNEEEAALIDALKNIGPYWAKILEFYGPGGSISEALKSRSQVQLKDKARNWKMSYLKNGLSLPVYLEKVTGVIERDEQLKKRQKRDRELKEKEKELKETN